MTRRAGVALRWGRAAVLASVACTTGVIAHLSAGGLLPGASAMLVVLAGCTLWAAALLGRPASRRRVVVMVMACQTLTHGALTALAGHHGEHAAGGSAQQALARVLTPPPSPVTVMDGGRRASWTDQMHVADPAAGAPVQLTLPAPVQHVLADFTGPHALMAIAHLAAAGLLGWWLARGEQLVWSLVSLTARTALTTVGAVLGALRGSSVTRGDPVRLGPGRLEPESAGASRPVRWRTPAAARRGPPSAAAA